MPEPVDDVWMLCSACRKAIRFGAIHWVCSVSTCNRDRTRLVFCSVVCWDSHVATLRHRDSWAVEAVAPTKEAWQAELAEQGDSAPAPSTPAVAKPPTPASGVGTVQRASGSDTTQSRGLPPSTP